jgi:hypothetical protein
MCLLLAGCGRASSSHPASSPAASAPPTFVASANAICAQQLAQLDKLPQPTTPEGAVSYLPQALAIMHSETTRLTALQVPASDRAQLNAGLASAGQLADLLRSFLGKLKSGMLEVSTFGQVQTQSDALKADVDAHFRQAGLQWCAA